MLVCARPMKRSAYNFRCTIRSVIVQPGAVAVGVSAKVRATPAPLVGTVTVACAGLYPVLRTVTVYRPGARGR